MSRRRGASRLAIATLVTALVASVAVVPVLARTYRVQSAQLAEPMGMAVDGTRVVWADRTTDGDFDVFALDVLTGAVVQVTDDPADQVAPDVSGDIVVWTDYRNTHADIYSRDLSTGVERRVTTNAANQLNPSVSGNRVAYEDYRNGYNTRIYVFNLSTSVETQLDSGYGVRKLRPRFEGDLIAFDDVSDTGSNVRYVNASTLSKVTIANDPARAELLARTDGRFVAWAVANPDTGIDLACYDTQTGQQLQLVANAGEQTMLAVSNGIFYWIDRSYDRVGPRVFSYDPAHDSRPHVEPQLCLGDTALIEASGDTVAWLAVERGRWVLRAQVRPRTPYRKAVTAASAMIASAASLVSPRDGLATASPADTTPPTTPTLSSAAVSGLSAVRLEWTAASDSNPEPLVYDIFRYSLPVTSGAVSLATTVTSVSGTLGADVALASDEASKSYTYFYNVRARDASGNVSGVGLSRSPNPHGWTRAGSASACTRCHTSAPHGGGSGYGALGAKTRFGCYQCHGLTSATTDYGVESSKNTQRAYYDYDGQTAGSRHRNVYMETNQTECDACHVPHESPYYVDYTGTYDSDNSYRRLLRVVEATNPATYFYSTDSTPAANALCFNCHGNQMTTMVIAGGAAAYAASGGDHNSSGYSSLPHGDAVVYADNTNPGIQCEVCHNNHGSPNASLTDYRLSGSSDPSVAGEANLCFKCHSSGSGESNVATGYSAPFSWNGRDVKAEFTSASRVSTHPTATATSGRSLTCASCHNTHYVAEGGASAWDTARMSDPRNTKDAPASVTAFCTGCHTASPPTAVRSDSTVVPYDVGFGSTSAWPYFTGWDKSGFTSAGHIGGTTAATCATCHDPHASNMPRLLAWTRPASFSGGVAGTRENTDASKSAEENLCYQCHGNGTTGVTAPGALDVATNAGLSYAHDPSLTSGKHADTETASNLTGVARHAECPDCHDAHNAKKVGGTATQDSLNSSIVGGAVYGAVGVQPTWPTTFMSAPSGFASRQLLGTAGDVEAYLCFKCHSSNTTVPGSQTDVAAEFNPNNPSYHNVLGLSIGMQSSFTAVGSDSNTYSMTWAIPTVGVFKAGYTANSMLTCTSCHTNEASGAKGPHGSSVQWLLDPVWSAADWKTASLKGSGSGITTNGTNDAVVMCAKCHDLYDDAANKLSNDAHATSQHQYSGGVLCIDCHVSIPHGWRRPRLLGYTTDGLYATRSNALDKVRISANGSTGEGHTLDSKGVANWSSSSCDTNGCQHSNDSMIYWP